eukprot:5249029-Prorocentrum_lima.AAC.1
MDAVLPAKLLYGLDTIASTQTARKALDVLQLKCIRKILRVPTTFICRRYSNEWLIERCGLELDK